MLNSSDPARRSALKTITSLESAYDAPVGFGVLLRHEHARQLVHNSASPTRCQQLPLASYLTQLHPAHDLPQTLCPTCDWSDLDAVRSGPNMSTRVGARVVINAHNAVTKAVANPTPENFRIALASAPQLMKEDPFFTTLITSLNLTLLRQRAELVQYFHHLNLDQLTTIFSEVHKKFCAIGNLPSVQLLTHVMDELPSCFESTQHVLVTLDRVPEDPLLGALTVSYHVGGCDPSVYLVPGALVLHLLGPDRCVGSSIVDNLDPDDIQAAVVLLQRPSVYATLAEAYAAACAL